MIIETINKPIEPWTIFPRIYNFPYPFILDSSVNGRYSFLGFDPFLIISSSGLNNSILFGGKKIYKRGDPFETLKEVLNRYRTENVQYPLQGGCVGYFGYDLKNTIERLPSNAHKDIPLPDLFFALYDTIYIYDHHTMTGVIASTGFPETTRYLMEHRAYRRLKNVKNILNKNSWLETFSYNVLKVIESNFTKEGYISAIRKVLSYIGYGDIYQANLSQRLVFNLPCHPLRLYSHLREKNPVPMGVFMKLGKIIIMSNSPERFLKIKGDTIETMPIKGTIRRGRDLKEDRSLIDILKNDPKENAEHTMIVDLERNDLGKVCRFGTIRVTEDKRIYSYSTLHHMVSTIKGKLIYKIHPVDAIRACFPGGSVTGAPKIRAMEIIDELEPTARGVYTGAIGYIDFSSQVDLNIAIRTAIIYRNRLYYQAGGGIVADSDPEKEYEETLLKTKALLNLPKSYHMELSKFRISSPFISPC